MGKAVTLLTVGVFLFIIFWKRILPTIKGNKKPAGTEMTVTGTLCQSPIAAGCMCCEVYAVNICNYVDLSELSSLVSLQVKKELDYISTKGSLISMDYVVVQSVLIVLFRWQG